MKKVVDRFETLPVMGEDFDWAAQLSSMYKCKNPNINPKQISLVDLLHATQIVKYEGKAFVVTTDINDYPSFIFDMPEYFPIEEGDGHTTFVGLKVFNYDKWHEMQSSFNASGKTKT